MQLSYTDAPPTSMPGMLVDTTMREIISRIVSTQRLVQVDINGADDGTFTITIDGVVVATFAASSSTAGAIRDDLLADLVASAAAIQAESLSTASILIEGTDEDNDFTSAVNSTGTGGDITQAELVAFGQEIPFGVGLVADPRAAVEGNQARLPRLAAEITGGPFLGVSFRDSSIESNENGYPDKSAVPIVHRGRIYPLIEDPNDVTPEGMPAVYCRFAAGAGGTQLGAFRTDDDTASCALVPNARYRFQADGTPYIELF